jgi:hypothetical protein
MEFIYSNYSLKKIRDNGLEKWQVEKALSEPDRTEFSPIPDCTSFIRINNHLEVGVIARKKDSGAWIIVTVWKRVLL